VEPQVAIYSCGVGNSYGFPDPQTLTNLAAVGATVYGTDVNGTVIVTTDGSTYQVKTSRGQPRTPSGTTTSTTQGNPPPVTSTTLGGVPLTVESLTSPISRGSTASLTIKTAPGAQCTITVLYKSGPSSSAGLGPQTAGADAMVTWSWKVSSSTTPGTWSITVTAESGGGSNSLTISFQVTS
jgi:hypothetical protein